MVREVGRYSQLPPELPLAGGGHLFFLSPSCWNSEYCGFRFASLDQDKRTGVQMCQSRFDFLFVRLRTAVFLRTDLPRMEHPVFHELESKRGGMGGYLMQPLLSAESSRAHMATE